MRETLKPTPKDRPLKMSVAPKPTSDEKYYKGEKLDEVQNYIATHRIPEIIQSLTQALLVERPENPKLFMEKHLQLLRSIKVSFTAKDDDFTVCS